MRQVYKYLFPILLTIIHTFCFSQWTDITFDTTNFYRVVKFQNQNEGLIMGDTGIIFKTIDGGNSWNNIICPININIADFQYINDTIVYAYGQDRIIKSEDSGNSWDSSYILPASTAKLNFLNQNTGFASGFDGIFKSNDAGMNWISVWNYSIGPYGFGSIIDIEFINDSIGFACGSKHISGGGIFGIILKTTNYGNTWNIVYDNAPYGDAIENIEFVDDYYLYCSPISTNILKSIDLGITWTNLNIIIEPYGKIESFFFKNNDTSYAVSSPSVWTLEGCTSKRKIFRTVDGWQTWITQYLDASYLCQNELLNSVYFNNDSTGFAVGYKKVLTTYNYGGNTNIIDTIPYATDIHTIEDDNIALHFYPNPTVDYLNIETNKDIEIEIATVHGLVINKLSLKKGHITYDMTNLLNGIYFIRIIGGSLSDGKKNIKIIKM